MNGKGDKCVRAAEQERERGNKGESCGSERLCVVTILSMGGRWSYDRGSDIVKGEESEGTSAKGLLVVTRQAGRKS